MPGRVYGCIFDDVHGLASRDIIGMGQIMFETDYPHSDSTFPHSRQTAEKIVGQAGLDDDETWQLVRGNAIECYELGPLRDRPMTAPYTDEELATGDFERNEVTHRQRDPYKVGVCMDFAGGTQIARDFYDGIQLAIDEAVERGDVEHPIELVIREVIGPMRGTSTVVLDAWRELAHEEDCLVIIGPVVTEANLAIVEEVNRSKVPTISFCATFDWAGPYCYALQNGGFPDEADVLAAYMARQGHRRVGVFHEAGLIGEEFFAAFTTSADRHGLTIVGDHTVGLFNTQRPVEPQLEAVRAAGAEAIVVLSAYGALAPVQRALAAVEDDWDWHPPATRT